MVFGAVSFEELLGHCGEALSVYARHADAIESRLASFGYEPPGNDAKPHRFGFDSQTSAAFVSWRWEPMLVRSRRGGT
jgi:hypothetical protein